MKKSLIGLLVLMISCSVCISTFAEKYQESDHTHSQYLQALNQKGVLTIEEITNTAQIGGIRYAKCSIKEVNTGYKYNAIMFEAEYYNSMVDQGTANNIVDADEIDNIISTLEYIKAHISDQEDYTEIKYIAKSGLGIGAYHSASEEEIFIELATDVRIMLDMKEIDNLIRGINRIKSLLGD